MASSTTPMLSMTTTESGMPMSAPLTMGGGQAPNFADDLKAISLPEMSGVHQIAQTVAVEKPAASTQMEVKVKKGDVLERIARKHGVSVDELMKANQLSSSQLKIGQVLKIPGKTAPKSEPAAVAHAPASAPTPAAASEENAQYYIVKNGDNPWTIAVKNHIKVEDLLRLNNLNEEKARRLKPGDKLRVK